MRVCVVTDSTSDLDRVTAESLGITVVPIYVRWGSDVYRDGADLTPAQFYERLVRNRSHPATTQPSPDDFTKAYKSLADAAGIISIHISSKISGTFNSAKLAADGLRSRPTPIEVVDSGLNSAGLAVVVLAAARVASQGGSFGEILAEAQHATRETRMVGLFNTMKYLARGGRISPATGLAGTILHVKPILTFRDGEIVRAGLARSREGGISRLLQLVTTLGQLGEVIVSHSTREQEVGSFVQRVREIHACGVSRVFEMGAALGVHGGPGMIIVAGRRA